MKKRILILTFADHISDEQARIITETHRQATGLYSGAVLKNTYAPGTEHEISLKTVCENYHDLMKETENMKPRDMVTGEPVFQSESFCCDMCGNQKVGRRNKVYDENFVLQPDIYQCDECKNSEYEPDAVAEMSKHFEPDVWAKIVKNYDPNFFYKKPLHEIELKHIQPRHFLKRAFTWNESPEKAIYWGEIYTALQEKDL